MKLAPLFLLFILAGCTEPAPQAAIDLEEPITQNPDLFGKILDENGDLLNNVTLTLYPGKIIFKSNGTFEFFNVTKDVTLQIDARKEGYRNSTAQLRLSEGLAAQIIFPMPSLASLPPQFVISEFAGYIACETSPNLPCPTASDDKYAQYTAFAPESDLALKQTVAELFWDSSAYAQTLRVQISDSAGILLTEDVEPGWKWTRDSGEPQFTFRIQTSEPGFVLNQQFDLYITHFYNRPGPDDYSIETGIDES